MFKRLLKNIALQYRTLTPEDYLYNQRDSLLAKSPHKKTLYPLVNANQGDMLVSDEIQLIGVPKGQTIEKGKSDTF